MAEIAHSIDLKLRDKLKDRAYRKRYFLAEGSAHIAEQLIALRKKRKLSQKALADQLNTKQPAISRVESAEYRNWSFNTLLALAEAMDARLRIFIEPAEDVLAQYDSETLNPGMATGGQPSPFNFRKEIIPPKPQQITRVICTPWRVALGPNRFQRFGPNLLQQSQRSAESVPALCFRRQRKKARAFCLGVRGFVSRSICHPLAFDTLHGFEGALCVSHA